jgi:hypothetical protein
MEVEAGGLPVPEELAIAVVSLLDIPSLAQFALVSRSCHRLALDDAVWCPTLP